MSRAQIQTYSSYNEAWCLRKSSEESLALAQSRLDGFRNLQTRRVPCLGEVMSHLRRGFLTLELIRRIRISEMPDVAKASTLWLPVQAYYAAHGFGLAFLSTTSDSGQTVRTHADFLRVSSKRIVEHLLPQPFSAVLRGGFRGWKYMPEYLAGLPGHHVKIIPHLNVSTPTPRTRDSHVAQCLNTTRGRLIESRLKDARVRGRRKGKSKTRLNAARQRELAKTVNPTTVFDYLYRVRKKSNYEDVAMFQERPNGEMWLLDLARSLQELAIAICSLLFNALWRVLDDSGRSMVSSEIDTACLLESNVSTQGLEKATPLQGQSEY